jgi:nitrite reductase (NO-forming)
MEKVKALYLLLIVLVLTSGLIPQQTFDLEKSVAKGKEIYSVQCITCHLSKGEGIPTVYPPLANSDFLKNQPEKSISFLIYGASESITVNGIEYSGEMQNLKLTDEQVSDVMNYIRNSWGNKGEPLKPSHILAIREKGL